MALKIEDLAKPETLLVSLLLMAGSYVLLPVLGGLLRPVAKNVVKAGVMAADWVQATAAETMESVRDMSAEARDETRHAGSARKPDVKAPAATTP
jgi:hypothetical protein